MSEIENLSAGEFIKIKSLPHLWQLMLEGKVHYSRKDRECPYCGKTIVNKEEPFIHLECTKCGRRYV